MRLGLLKHGSIPQTRTFIRKYSRKRDQLVILTGKKEDGQPIRDLATWFEHAPPAGGSKQWKDYRSAKELARAWFRHGVARIPDELCDVIRRYKQTKGIQFHHAVAEMEIAFDDFTGGRRNADLMMWGTSKEGRNASVVVTIEAKADEEFGKSSIGETHDQALRSGKHTNAPARAQQLSRAIMGRELDETIAPLRYQLFHALAATACLAKAKNAALGLLVIHEFVSITIDFDKFVQNANDLSAFVRRINGWENAVLKCGEPLKPVRLPGTPPEFKSRITVPNDVDVSIAKIRTLIPLGSDGRVYSINADTNGRQRIILS